MGASGKRKEKKSIKVVRSSRIQPAIPRAAPIETAAEIHCAISSSMLVDTATPHPADFSWFSVLQTSQPDTWPHIPPFATIFKRFQKGKKKGKGGKHRPLA